MPLAASKRLHPDRLTPDVTREGVRGMLEELGGTPDEVAEALRAAGIKGVRNTVRFLNPVVKYAHSKVSDVYGIDLIQGDRLRIVFANGQVTEVAVPEPVLRFLENFHRGQYPDLEMPTDPG
jgi:hypothetical protein